MRIKISFLLLIATSLSVTLCAQNISDDKIKVKSEGETVVVKKLSKSDIQVKLITREIRSADEKWSRRPDEPKNSCTYSRVPCSVVDYIGISVNGDKIIVPRSVFADLADINLVTISSNKENNHILAIEGGDASESYGVMIYFDSERVLKRNKLAGNNPDELLQETVYHIVDIGD